MNEIESVAKFIDHTNLRNDLLFEDVKVFCEEALEFGFYSVCLQPFYVPFAIDYLKNTNAKVGSIAGFPYGANSSVSKIAEVESLVKLGVDEIDFVMNIPAFLNKQYDAVESEFEKAIEICHSSYVVFKVIIETGLLIPEEIATATRLVCNSGADFVKTSTGITSRGVTYEDILIIKENISEGVKIKASGGIRTYEDILKFIEAGASRIGTSRAVDIFKKLL
jgi:deoxyribose-phosphate aldolase